eukprot:Gb_23350 [translate_table: standard]
MAVSTELFVLNRVFELHVHDSNEKNEMEGRELAPLLPPTSLTVVWWLIKFTTWHRRGGGMAIFDCHARAPAGAGRSMPFIGNILLECKENRSESLSHLVPQHFFSCMKYQTFYVCLHMNGTTHKH